MAITTLTTTETGSASRVILNDNFTDLDTTKADLASPVFTGTPTLPTGTVATTQSANDNSTKIATTAYVDSSVTPIFKAGIGSKNTADASTTQTIAHGLGKIPKFIKLIVNALCIDDNLAMTLSFGSYNGTNNYCTYSCNKTSNSTTSDRVFVTSTTWGIAIGARGASPETTGQTGIVTVDATNIIITWTKTGSPTGTSSFMWEAQ